MKPRPSSSVPGSGSRGRRPRGTAPASLPITPGSSNATSGSATPARPPRRRNFARWRRKPSEVASMQREAWGRSSSSSSSPAARPTSTSPHHRGVQPLQRRLERHLETRRRGGPQPPSRRDPPHPRARRGRLPAGVSRWRRPGPRRRRGRGRKRPPFREHLPHQDMAKKHQKRQPGRNQPPEPAAPIGKDLAEMA